VDHDWSGKTWFADLLLPGKVFIIIFVFLEKLSGQFLFRVSRCRLTLFSSFILQVESDWELEIKLDCSALMLSLECIVDLDIDLWSIESTISGVDCPWFTKLIKSTFKCSFCFVPKIVRSKSSLWSGR